MNKIIKIEGMSCSHCAKAVAQELEALEGVSNVEVSLKQKQATLNAAESVTDDRLKGAVEEAGYKVTEIQ